MLNRHWTRGNYSFNNNDPKSTLLLELWKQKAKTSKFYRHAFDTRTKRDTTKCLAAVNNQLDYKSFYTYDGVEQWLNQI